MNYKTIVITLFLGCFLILITPKTTVAQLNISLDSLWQLHKYETNDSIQMEALSNLVWRYRKINLDTCLQLAKQLVDLTNNKNAKACSRAYNLLGLAYRYNGYSTDTIINTFQQAILFTEKKDCNCPISKANILNNIATTYKNNGQYDKAFKLNLDALKVAQELQDTLTVINIYNNIGVIFFDKRDNDKAKWYYQNGLYLAKTINNKQAINTLSLNLGNIYYEQNILDTALIYYEVALQVRQELNDIVGQITALKNISLTHKTLKNHEIGLQYLKDAYNLAKSIGYKRGLSSSLISLSIIHLESKQYNQAIKTANDALDILEESSNFHEKVQVNNILSEAFEGLGKYQLALNHHKIYKTLEDSIFQKDKQQQIEELEIQYQVSQKETENTLLKTEKLVANEKVKSRTAFAFGVLAILLLLGGWSLFIYRSNLQRKRLNEQLEIKVNERTIELQTTNKHLKQANYELRTFNYIASHDIKEPIRNIGSYAGLIHRKLPVELRQSLQSYFDTIKTSTTQLYTLIEDFAKYTTLSKNEKVELEQVDLMELAKNLHQTLTPNIKQCNGILTYENLPVIQSNNSILFTTLKNLIENGLKYNQSEVPSVQIKYTSTDRYHLITISDNGIGIDSQYHNKIFEMFKRLHNRGEYSGSGIGLAIVKLIIGKLNGTIEVKSQEEEGSQFTLRLLKKGSS